jgi:hypothetical protein
MAHADGDSDAKMRLAERALAVAESATEAATASATGRHGVTQGNVTGSGEFQAVLISLVQELKVDSREHRQKLETVLVRLAEGDGRMGRIELQGDATRDRLGAIESRLAVVERTGDETRGHLKGVESRLAGIESGAASGIQKAVKAAVATVTPPPQPQSDKHAKAKSGDGWISTGALIKVVGIAAGLLTTVITCYFAFRQTQVQVQGNVPVTAPAIVNPATVTGK